MSDFLKPNLVELGSRQVASSSLRVAAHGAVVAARSSAPVQTVLLAPMCTSTTPLHHPPQEKKRALLAASSECVCVSCELWPTCYFRSLPPRGGVRRSRAMCAAAAMPTTMSSPLSLKIHQKVELLALAITITATALHTGRFREF